MKIIDLMNYFVNSLLLFYFLSVKFLYRINLYIESTQVWSWSLVGSLEKFMVFVSEIWIWYLKKNDGGGPLSIAID